MAISKIETTRPSRYLSRGYGTLEGVFTRVMRVFKRMFMK